MGGQQPGDGVGGPGSRGDQNDAGFAAGAGVAVGHVGGALLVAGKDELELGRIQQSVEDGHGGAAGMAEDVFNTLALHGFDNCVGTSHGKFLLKCKNFKYYVYHRQ